jgi:hypothetical protein
MLVNLLMHSLLFDTLYVLSNECSVISLAKKVGVPRQINKINENKFFISKCLYNMEEVINYSCTRIKRKKYGTYL